MDPRDLGSEIGAADECGAIRYLDIRPAALGGGLVVRASADAREDWNHGIYENSRYATFMLDGTLRLVSSGLGMPKFCTRKVRSLERAAELIADYMAEA